VAEPVAHRLLAGTYLDSVVLMQVQRSLAALPGVVEAAAVMATPANRELLAAQGMWPGELAARPDDLMVAVRAGSQEVAEAALSRLEELLAARPGAGSGGEEVGHRPRSLAGALGAHPEARWVLVSVPGRWAAGVAREALAADRHVFLFSDNVPVAEEVAPKAEASRRGLLLLGPDCGSALVAGIGLGFANRVARGGVGIVAASGTGLQAVACGIDARGGGVSHALGIGSRDLSAEVGGVTGLQALDLLARDPGTRVLVLVSKPPAPEVGAQLLRAARAIGKPVVVWYLGAPLPARRLGSLWFAAGSEEAAALAVEMAAGRAPALDDSDTAEAPLPTLPSGACLRGLFSGGTLAAEAFLGLAPLLAPLASNLHLPGAAAAAPGAHLSGHAVLDLGADEYTVGRPHPMLEPALVAERIEREAADPSVGLLLVDVVLGDGAHPDPAAVLAPVLEAALGAARRGGRDLRALAILIGATDDPQGRDAQAAALAAAGARVVPGVAAAVQYAVGALPAAPDRPPGAQAPVPLAALDEPLSAIDVGLESFHAGLAAQGAAAAHVDWRPPAGGDERLAGILARMKGGPP